MQNNQEFRNQVQDEAFELSKEYNSGTYSIAMRLGKTCLGLRIANRFNKVLVSYPNQPIRNSWEEDSIKFSIPIENITFTTHLSLIKHNLTDFDCVILDEIDQVSVEKWKYIEENLPKRLFGLTGTPAKFGEKKSYMDDYCPIIYEKKLSETTGITNKDYLIKVHLIEPSSVKDIELKSGNFWSEKAKISFFETKYKQNRDWNTMLMLLKSISNSKTKFEYAKKLLKDIERGIFFLETIEQCKGFGIPTYHTKEKNSEQNLTDFQEGAIDKMSTILQLKAGITINSLNEGLILHAYSSNNRLSQRIGRFLNYIEGEVALIHIICLKGTRDENWLKSGLEEFSKDKIEYINIKT